MVPFLARSYSTWPSVEKEESTTNEKGLGFKRHNMLAPFMARWQSTDLHPLVIEKYKDKYVYDNNGKKYHCASKVRQKSSLQDYQQLEKSYLKEGLETIVAFLVVKKYDIL
ncbi:hypothetical protein ACFX15_040289 [Malus domestica]